MKVVSGTQAGATGMVLKVEQHVLIILSDTTKEDVSQILVFPFFYLWVEGHCLCNIVLDFMICFDWKNIEEIIKMSVLFRFVCLPMTLWRALRLLLV